MDSLVIDNRPFLLHTVMFEVGFQFGYCCFACYLFGVAYTLSEVGITKSAMDTCNTTDTIALFLHIIEQSSDIQ